MFWDTDITWCSGRSRCAAVNCSLLALVEARAVLDDPATLTLLVAAGR